MLCWYQFLSIVCVSLWSTQSKVGQVVKMLYFLGSPTLALNAYERRLRPWDHQRNGADRKGTSILKGIWYSPAIPLLYDTILIYI